MGYLDNTGLKRFTAWVKSRLSHYLEKTGGEVDGDFTLSAHNGASEFNLYPDGVTLSASAVGSESEAKSALSLNPDHISIEIANYYGGTSGVVIDPEGISIGGDPVVTEQSLNPAVDEKLVPFQDELANIQNELLNKVTQDEFASAMEDAPFLPLSGGTMTGPLAVQTPTETSHAASKGYVDSAVGDEGFRLDAAIASARSALSAEDSRLNRVKSELITIAANINGTLANNARTYNVSNWGAYSIVCVDIKTPTDLRFTVKPNGVSGSVWNVMEGLLHFKGMAYIGKGNKSRLIFFPMRNPDAYVTCIQLGIPFGVSCSYDVQYKDLKTIVIAPEGVEAFGAAIPVTITAIK